MKLSGIKRSKEILEQLAQERRVLQEKFGLVPKLVVITVGDDPASNVYVGQKEKKALSLGYDFDWKKFDQNLTQDQLMTEITRLNQDPQVNGILLQLPLPKHLDERALIEHIAPQKDVDGFHPINLGHLMANQANLMPCTPRGVIDLLKANNIAIAGKNVVIVGRSLIVGLPQQLMMIHEHATVTVCHSRTKDLSQVTRQADILVVAIGVAHKIKAEDVKEGAVVIDVGINRLEDGTLAGDVDYDQVYNKVAAITPVPGGVGPMTVAILMQQTLLATCQQHGIDPLLLKGEV